MVATAVLSNLSPYWKEPALEGDVDAPAQAVVEEMAGLYFP